ncbi:unnamed protein product [Closterium sp. Naga37s-1]|nr:unnamed protein product [Closterium sp. Naga37s-1]
MPRHRRIVILSPQPPPHQPHSALSPGSPLLSFAPLPPLSPLPPPPPHSPSPTSRTSVTHPLLEDKAEDKAVLTYVCPDPAHLWTLAGLELMEVLEKMGERVAAMGLKCGERRLHQLANVFGEMRHPETVFSHFRLDAHEQETLFCFMQEEVEKLGDVRNCMERLNTLRSLLRKKKPAPATSLLSELQAASADALADGEGKEEAEKDGDSSSWMPRCDLPGAEEILKLTATISELQSRCLWSVELDHAVRLLVLAIILLRDRIISVFAINARSSDALTREGSLGRAGLALRYAKVINLAEKLMKYPFMAAGSTRWVRGRAVWPADLQHQEGPRLTAIPASASPFLRSPLSQIPCLPLPRDELYGLLTYSTKKDLALRLSRPVTSSKSKDAKTEESGDSQTRKGADKKGENGKDGDEDEDEDDDDDGFTWLKKPSPLNDPRGLGGKGGAGKGGEGDEEDEDMEEWERRMRKALSLLPLLAQHTIAWNDAITVKPSSNRKATRLLRVQTLFHAQKAVIDASLLDALEGVSRLVASDASNLTQLNSRKMEAMAAEARKKLDKTSADSKKPRAVMISGIFKPKRAAAGIVHGAPLPMVFEPATEVGKVTEKGKAPELSPRGAVPLSPTGASAAEPAASFLVKSGSVSAPRSASPASSAAAAAANSAWTRFPTSASVSVAGSSAAPFRSSDLNQRAPRPLPALPAAADSSTPGQTTALPSPSLLAQSLLSTSSLPSSQISSLVEATPSLSPPPSATPHTPPPPEALDSPKSPLKPRPPSQPPVRPPFRGSAANSADLSGGGDNPRSIGQDSQSASSESPKTRPATAPASAAAAASMNPPLSASPSAPLPVSQHTSSSSPRPSTAPSSSSRPTTPSSRPTTPSSRPTTPPLRTSLPFLLGSSSRPTTPPMLGSSSSVSSGSVMSTRPSDAVTCECRTGLGLRRDRLRNVWIERDDDDDGEWDGERDREGDGEGDGRSLRDGAGGGATPPRSRRNSISRSIGGALRVLQRGMSEQERGRHSSLRGSNLSMSMSSGGSGGAGSFGGRGSLRGGQGSGSGGGGGGGGRGGGIVVGDSELVRFKSTTMAAAMMNVAAEMAVRPSAPTGAVVAATRSGSSARVATPVLPPLKPQKPLSHRQASVQHSPERVQLASMPEQEPSEMGDMARWRLVFSALFHANGLAEEAVEIPRSGLAGISGRSETEEIPGYFSAERESLQGTHHVRDGGLLPLVSMTGEETRMDAEQVNGIKFPHQHVLGVATSDPPGSTQLQTNLEPKKDSELRDDYYVNVGYAIRTLREELPTLFYRDMTYDIYREDITFQDPMNTFKGVDNYRLIFKALRFHGKIFFKALCVDVLRVWQPNERTIQIRWSVRGIPRLPWEAHGRFDGTSEYKLDSSGKIYSHKVDNIVMSDPPKYQPLTVMELLRLSGAQTTPTISCSCRASQSVSSPVSPLEGSGGPGLLSFQQLLAEGAVFLAVVSRFTWIRFYCALSGTLALQKRRGGGEGEEELAASSG